MVKANKKEIAVLFAEKNGIYSSSEIVELWGEEKDARKYNGNLPVIAHPPCQLWGSLAFVNYSRWGGKHNKPGNDQGCFISALNSVNKFYGVLEHPAKTRAWEKYGLKKPIKGKWIKSGIGWVCEVWQSAYNHKANKATWLYYNGKNKPYELNWKRPIGKFQIGFQDQRGKLKNKPTLNKKESNETPEKFKNELISLVLFSIKNGEINGKN